MPVTIRKLREESDAVTYVVVSGSLHSKDAVIKISRQQNAARGTPTRGAEIKLIASNTILNPDGSVARKQDSAIARRVSAPAELSQVALDEQVAIANAVALAVKSDVDSGFLPDSTTYSLTLV